MRRAPEVKERTPKEQMEQSISAAHIGLGSVPTIQSGEFLQYRAYLEEHSAGIASVVGKIQPRLKTSGSSLCSLKASLDKYALRVNPTYLTSTLDVSNSKEQ